MRKKKYRAYALLTLFLILTLSLSSRFVNSLRAKTVGVSGAFSRSSSKGSLKNEPLEIANENLKAQNERLIQLLLSEEKQKKLTDRIHNVELDIVNRPKSQEFLDRRKREFERHLELEKHLTYARVSYRDPTNWGDALWISLGEIDRSQGVQIDVGSPVLSGAYVIGIVDYVGKRHSRVRLLTDSTLTPSVRAVRGSSSTMHLMESIERMQLELNLSESGALMKEESDLLDQILAQVKGRLGKEVGDKYLAKGELSGSSATQWRSKIAFLKGEGFNYDFADVEGEARELRTGVPMDKVRSGEILSLIDVGDLLVTTGFDGVFPAGLPIAVVTEVGVLQEGAIAYDIEAALCAGSLSEVEEVSVLPSMQFSLERE